MSVSPRDLQASSKRLPPSMASLEDELRALRHALEKEQLAAAEHRIHVAKLLGGLKKFVDPEILPILDQEISELGIVQRVVDSALPNDMTSAVSAPQNVLSGSIGHFSSPVTLPMDDAVAASFDIPAA